MIFRSKSSMELKPVSGKRSSVRKLSRSASMISLRSNSTVCSNSKKPSIDHQSFSLRAKKCIIPKLLSKRKLTLSLLNPISASAMNNIHYLLKAHILPKEHFRELDRGILRMLLKIGVVAQDAENVPEAVSLMHRIEHLTKRFVQTFIKLANQNVPPTDIREATHMNTLLDTLIRLRASILNLVDGRLSQSSINLIKFVFTDLLQENLWESIFYCTPDNLNLVSLLSISFENVLLAKIL